MAKEKLIKEDKKIMEAFSELFNKGMNFDVDLSSEEKEYVIIKVVDDMIDKVLQELSKDKEISDEDIEWARRELRLLWNKFRSGYDPQSGG